MLKNLFLLSAIVLFSLKSHAASLTIVEKKSGSISFVSLDSGVIERVKVGYLPHEVALTSTHAFVSDYGHQHVRSSSLENKPGNTLSMINLANPNEVEKIDLGNTPCAPHGIETSLDEKYVFVTCEGRQEIAVISTKEKKVEKFLRTNQPGSHMLTVGLNNQLFVTNFWIGTVSIIDIQTGSILKQINTGRSTEGIGLSPNGKFIYVTVVETNELLKISTSTLSIVSRATLAKGTSPIRVLVSNDNSKLIVNHSSSDITGIYNAQTLELIKEIPVGRQPIGLALSRKSNRAYVANMNDGSISVIDIQNNKIIKTLRLGLSSPDGLAVFN